MPPSSDNPWDAISRNARRIWSDVRTRGLKELWQLVPFLKWEEPPVWDQLAKLTLKQAREENGVLLHLAAWLPGVVTLALANFLSATALGPRIEIGGFGELWGVIAIGAWTIGLAVHGSDVYFTKRPKFERKRDELMARLHQPAPRGEDAVETDALRERLITAAEETRSSLTRVGNEASTDLVSRGERQALSLLAWLDGAQRQLGGRARDRQLRRVLARQLSDPGHSATGSELSALLEQVDRAERLRHELRQLHQDRRARLESFLLALENARLASPEALPAMEAPLSERVRRLEEGEGTAQESESADGRIAQELKLAQELQQSILPTEAPPIEGLSVAQAYRPCSELGGDFYDFYPQGPDRLLVSLGDASGHGLDSSMVSSMAKSALYMQVASERPLDEAMAEINRMMCDTLGRRRMMTMVLLQFDAGRGVVRWVNAGQVYPVLRRADGSIEELEQPGYPLGIRRDTTFTIAERELRPGDLVLLVTDGLVEAEGQSGEPFGWERLHDLLARLPGPDPNRAVDTLADELTRHLGAEAPQDDVTLVAVAHNP